MKKLIKHGFVLLVATILSSSFAGNQAKAQAPVTASVSYQNFYDDLSPYGTWIDYPAYGHVWHPKIAGDFRPYLTNGYWDYSTEGWLWQSNYNWGWAPFHYGRWVYDDRYGWLWVPGYEWSPAWVTWGNVDNYYAWAPLMPEVNVSIAFGLWRPASFYWNICGRDHIYDRNIFSRVERRNIVGNYVNRITIINNFSTTRLHNQYYSKGPDVNEVGRYTNHKIQTASIREVNNNRNTSGERLRGNEVQVYRPTVINPQPREFRRVDKNKNPVHNNGDRINNRDNQQRDNVDRLPVHRAPGFSHGNSNNNGGNNKRNRRN